MTFEKSKQKNCRTSTFCVQDFLVNLFQLLGKGEDLTTPEAQCFLKSQGFLKTKDRDILFSKNVKGLLNHDRGKTFQTILKILSDLGYQTQWQLLNSKFFGVPQNRERVYIVGCYGKECAGKIFPITETSGQNSCQNKIKILFDGHSQLNRIYDKTGISPCLTASHWIQGSLVNEPTLKQIPETSGKPQGSRIYATDGI